MAVQAQYPPRPWNTTNALGEERGEEKFVVNGDLLNSNSSSLLRKRSRDDFAASAMSMPQLPDPGQIRLEFLDERDPISQLYYQGSLETEALVRDQIDRMRSEYEVLHKRQHQILMLSIEQRTAKRMREKEAELASARQRNAELLEKATKMAAERQIWMNIARNNEAAVASLRYALLQSGGGGVGGAKEGLSHTDDAQSCCYEEEEEEEEKKARGKGKEGGGGEERRRACKVCGRREACVVMLPCRHLCLCKACESAADTCPVCRCPRKYAVEVLVS
ncbi:probable BOI-related E3 ubiquitin-protein ligase 2 [Typha angustifolia]|uniref:probable BOI-related E3 ubiquitin-protein ligase 2 n=1 Tax=Typha angustifolia TaxID=59011 RepID=UPI003C2BC17A